MPEQLKILHYNIGKRKQVQWSMLNDEGLKDMDAIATVEPYIFEDIETKQPTCGTHRHWQIFLPTSQRPDGMTRHKYRAAIWIRAGARGRAIPIDSHDMVAVQLTAQGTEYVIITAYDPADKIEGQSKADAELERKLELIEEAIKQIRKDFPQAGIIVTSDLNRHHPLWGGTMDADKPQDGEAIVDFAYRMGLQSLLPPGTVTWNHQSLGYKSCIDVILANHALADKMAKCRLADTDHGSDHWAIEAVFDPPEGRKGIAGDTSAPTKLMYNRTDWSRVNKEIEERLPATPEAGAQNTEEDLERLAQMFGRVVRTAVINHTPRAQPSPYAKRWWTEELTILRRAMTAARNKMVKMRRHNEPSEGAQTLWKQARKAYFHKMDKSKKRHWNDFLSDPNNIWKANQYTKLTNAGMHVPTLEKEGTIAESDAEKANLLMDTFFPSPPDPCQEQEQGPEAIAQWSEQRKRMSVRIRSSRTDGTGQLEAIPAPELRMPKITEKEIKRAIQDSNPKKAAGMDELTFAVWQKVLPSTLKWIHWLYNESLDKAYIPKAWKEAKLVAIRKPGKPDYTVPKAYRPISLLSTLSKGLESILAKRLAHMAESLQLLPATHFGGRPRRSCEMAINLLVARVSEAWRAGRVLSLITFDVQGAFNGVHPQVLARRLSERGIPHQLVRWIVQFVTGRRASIQLGKHLAEMMDVRHAGIPQGSPLSPILFIFYNANLIGMPVDARMGTFGCKGESSPKRNSGRGRVGPSSRPTRPN